MNTNWESKNPRIQEFKNSVQSVVQPFILVFLDS